MKRVLDSEGHHKHVQPALNFDRFPIEAALGSRLSSCLPRYCSTEMPTACQQERGKILLFYCSNAFSDIKASLKIFQSSPASLAISFLPVL